MPNPRVAIVLGLIDRATKPLKALSGTAGATGKALAKMGDQAAASRKLDRLESKLNGSRRATGGLRRGLRELSGETRDAAATTDRLVRWQERLGRSAGQARAQIGRLGRALDARLSRASRTPPRGGRGGFLPGLAGGIVGSAIFSGIGRAVRGLAGFVETASQFETLGATLGTIEGSSAKAKKSLKWVEEFTSKTPFRLGQVSDAFVKLRAYGMDPTNGMLRILGDTAAGMGKSLDQAVEAIADAAMGENERLKEFAVKARTEGDTVTYTLGDRSRTADKNDPAAIQRALLELLDEKFGGAMADRMNTFAGMVSNLGDKWTVFQKMVMDGGPFDALKARLRGVLARIDAMHASGELQKLADRVGEFFTEAFAKFESEIWPVLRDEIWPTLRDDIWPTLKDIADAVGGIFKQANKVAEAFGGWGSTLKGIAYLKALSFGAGALGGGYRRLQSGSEAYRTAKKLAASRSARRMRKSGGRLLRSLPGAVRAGPGKAVDLGRGILRTGKAAAGKGASGIAKFGKMLATLATRFAPLLMGALKALAAVFAGISLPVVAAIAAIAGAAFLVWKYWEPIKGFFAKLWESVKAAFSSAWERLSSIDWSDLGRRLLSTLATGIKAAAGLPFKALELALGKLRDLLPGSDARAGPLSRLTASGMAILPTMGEGVRRAGPRSLSRPLARAFGTATAGLALALPAFPAPSSSETAQAIPPSRAAQQRVVHYHFDNRIEIRQLPGESEESLARRVLEELRRMQGEAEQGAAFDAS